VLLLRQVSFAMRLTDWNEKQFIQEVLGCFATTAATDAFDDAVIVDLADLVGLPGAPYLVYSVDQPSFVRHADRDIDPFRFYGRWVAGVTCNDIIAMGARCRGFSLALAASEDTDAENIRSLAAGIVDVLRACGARYEGGNLDYGALGTVGVGWGVVPRHAVVRRSGARPGDRVVVTGEMGCGWLEYHVRANALEDQLDPGDKEKFRRYKRMPVGAASAVAATAEKGLLTSGMDLSDGLVEYLYTLVSRGSVGCVIDASALPVSAATIRNLPLLCSVMPDSADVLRRQPRLIAFDPGYDSPLLHGFTVRPEALPAAQQMFRDHGAELHDIGEVISDPVVLLADASRQIEVPPFWDDQFREEETMAAWAKFLAAFA
jgi:thiamine-monophosphate kinase